ncbi:MAG: hypothetical protein KBD01_18000, partial [Acidobacteria bacterium]|nr:hypothetical protein [Acidobacteriota bacterium]
AAPLAARFLAALRAACLGRRVPLLGGDTVRAAPGAATLALTVCGIPWPGGPVLRSGGRPGDVLAVTGTLGGSGLGLAILRRGRPRGAAERDAVRAFRTPRARLEAARPLARAAHALMDVSDGLGLDLPRLARASGCGFEVEAAALPLHPGLRPLAPEPALRAALAGGEDYELLAALPPRAVGPVRRALSRHGLPLSVIGRLLPARSGGWLVRGGRRSRWPGGGWDPFARDRDPGLDRPPVLSVGRDERDGPPR